MKKDVKIRVLFKPGKSNRECKPLSLLGDLMQTERMELAVQSIIKENLYPIHDKSLNRSVALMAGLIQNQCDKGWVWIKGVFGKGPMAGEPHYWLECDGWAVESADIPGTMLTEPQAILVTEATEYRKEMKLKILSTRKSKQVTQWLLKQKKKRSSALQGPPTPVQPTPFMAASEPTAPTVSESTRSPEPEKAPAKTVPSTSGPVPATETSPTQGGELDAVARQLAAMDRRDKGACKDRLMAALTALKKESVSPTHIATAFLKEKVPTRSGRGLWNPRMVGDIFKQIEG